MHPIVDQGRREGRQHIPERHTYSNQWGDAPQEQRHKWLLKICTDALKVNGKGDISCLLSLIEESMFGQNQRHRMTHLAQKPRATFVVLFLIRDPKMQP
jgi:hypothetical protein